MAFASPHATAGLTHDHMMPAAPACPDQGNAAPCQHPNDCLACAAISLPVVQQPAARLRWTRLVYLASALRLRGEAPTPALFPPKPLA